MITQLTFLNTSVELQQAIPITTIDWDGELKPGVNLRDLHKWLKVKTKFTTWIERRIEEYEFVENVDFSASQNWEASKSITYGQGKIEYFGTLSMCKELAMVERTQRGKEARRYFIECERLVLEQVKQQSAQKVEYTSAQLVVLAKFKQTEKLVAELKGLKKSREMALIDNPQLADDPVIQKALEEPIDWEKLADFLQTTKQRAYEQVGLDAMSNRNQCA